VRNDGRHHLAYLRATGVLIACVLLVSLPVVGPSQAQAPAATSTLYVPMASVLRLPGKIVLALLNAGPNNADQIGILDAASLNLTVLGTGHSPSWSPDGTKIAFLDARGIPKGANLYIMNANGSGQTKLSSALSPIETPRWSPDGTKILFVGSPDVLNFYWAIINVDGSGERPLFGSQGGDAPAWSPDGTKIAFESSENNDFVEDIYVMNADGSGRRNLSNNARPNQTPQWSPDGTKITFVSVVNGKSTIFVMNADGTGQKPLTDGLRRSYGPAWSPDGSKIAYSEAQEFLGSIIVINADGSGRRVLITEGLFSPPAWSPDSTYVGFSRFSSGLSAVSTNGRVQVDLTHAARPDMGINGGDWHE
jgi:Tol biopolymer transport system component